MISMRRRQWLATVGAALLARPAFSRRQAVEKPVQDVVWHDAARKRALQVRLRLPATAPPWPLIVYSPGLGSGISNGAAWCDAWRAAGLMVATISHPQTNEDIWDARRGSLRSRLNVALQAAQLAQRVSDCRFVIDQCLQRADLPGRIDPQRIGAAGHSYGALTVQALAGQHYGGKPQFRDPRIAGAILFSPGVNPIEAAHSVAGITIPALCITGDEDGYVTFGIGEDAMRLGVPLTHRLAVYQKMPPGEKHLLVLKGADHMTFAGEPVDSMPVGRAPSLTAATDELQWKKVSAVSTQFWLRYFLRQEKTRSASFVEQAMRALGRADRLESK